MPPSTSSAASPVRTMEMSLLGPKLTFDPGRDRLALSLLLDERDADT